MRQNRLLLGQIVGPHGVRGDVLVRAFTADPRDIAAYGPLSDETGTRTLTLKIRHVTAKGVVARVDGIEDRTTAETLKGTQLYVDRGQLPQTGDDEYYHADLIGLAAVTEDGRPVGKVTGVQNYGAGDLIEVTLPESRRSVLVPFTREFVPEVDLNSGTVVVKLPE